MQYQPMPSNSIEEDPLRVLVVVPAFNAGDTTRGIEIARAIQLVGEETGKACEISFIYPLTTQSFDAHIRAAGFSARGVDLGFTDAEVAAIMRADHDGTEFLPDPQRAGELLDALISEFKAAEPDLIVYGFLPPVGIAAQIVGIPSVSYVPFPVYRPWVQSNFLRDIPDEMDIPPLQAAPALVRRRIAKMLSTAVVTTGFFRQPSSAAAARDRGWKNRQRNLFGMLGADLQLVNDLPGYYLGQDVGPRTAIGGPLYSAPTDQVVPDNIREHFAQEGLPKIFVAMGSSGEKQYLLSAIEAVSSLLCRAVILVPPHIASMEEARTHLVGVGDVLLTDQFVPAPAVNALADIAVIHGGQGTVQTAVGAGTPIVGIGMQWEQSNNIGRLVERGSAIRIPRTSWHAESVRTALQTLIDNQSYADAAADLKAELERTDGYRITGNLIWDLAESKQSTPQTQQDAGTV